MKVSWNFTGKGLSFQNDFKAKVIKKHLYKKKFPHSVKLTHAVMMLLDWKKKVKNDNIYNNIYFSKP